MRVARVLRRIWRTKPWAKIAAAVLFTAGLVTVVAFAMNQPQMQAWWSLRAEYGLRGAPEPKCDSDALELQLTQRVIDRDVDHGAILDIQVKRSETMPGRVDIEVATRTEDVPHYQMVMVSGLYGKLGDEDYRVSASPFGVESLLEVIEEGACGIWYRSADLQEERERTQRWKYEGLWAHQEYCFIVATATSHDGLFHSAAARSDISCVTTDWDSRWGAIEFPPDI